MGLEKMTVKAYSDSKFTRQVGADFQVSINPEKYARAYQVGYKDRQAQGSNGPSPIFNKYTSDTVSFELVFDGTGVVPGALPGLPSPVEQQLVSFKTLAYAYNGDIHRPNFLALSWGTLFFKCVLKSLAVNYTLFTPDGKPLRARANASFLGFNDEVELALKADKKSADLTHVRKARAGDTLPLMCFDIYGSSSYYTQVARVNGLVDFRNLVPGTQLKFPPLGVDVT